jgi:hypothetical protein
MSNSIFSDANKKQVWENEFTTDFLRQSGYARFMGKSRDSIIRTNHTLSDEKGTLIHMPMIPKLTGNGVTGSTLLRGNEEAQRNWSYAIRTSYAGNAATEHESNKFESEIELLNAAKPGLRDWAARRTRTLLSTQLASVVVRGTYGDASGNSQTVEDSNVAWGSATEAQKDAYLDNNSDRIVFADATLGQNALLTTAPAGGATNDMSATLAQTVAADKLSLAALGIAKRKAQVSETSTTKPSIMPVSTKSGEFEEEFVAFCDLNGFRDLQVEMASYNIDGRPRDPKSNPFFTGACLYYQGITIVPIPSMTAVGAVGASSQVVGNAFLCGQSALGVAYSMLPQARTDVYSYGQQAGVGIVMVDGYGKIAYNGAQAGVVTIFHASSAD